MLKLDEPMLRHTSWKVGGPADRFFVPADDTDLATFLTALPAAEPVTWIGLGSNVLVRDGGIRGTVISTTGMNDRLELLAGNAVRASSGTACAKVARFSARAGVAGAEFMAGIPGSVGGALAMNAGAFGAETWNIVEQVELVNRAGVRTERARTHFNTDYRRVELADDEWFLAAQLRLQPDPDGMAQIRISELLARRAATQPTGRFSCGSVFKNPEGDFAGRLIEQCGLKGCAIGAAVVSDKHANFIINTGDARAADIEALIRHVQATVAQLTGIRLDPEVRIIGETENHKATNPDRRVPLPLRKGGETQRNQTDHHQ